MSVDPKGRTMSVKLVLALDGSPQQETVQVRPGVPIFQCISELLQRKGQQEQQLAGGLYPANYGIFAAGSQVGWLSPRRTLSSYNLSEQQSLELRCFHNSLHVYFDDGTNTCVLVDRSHKVAEILLQIAQRFNLERFVQTYGLRFAERQSLAATGASAKSESHDTWLQNDMSLEEQNIALDEGVYFSKRIFELDPNLLDISEVDMGFAYFQGRRAFLRGSLDSDLSVDLAVELAAPLLLDRVGVQFATPISALVENHHLSILSPKYRKKSKRKEIVLKLTEVYRRLSSSLSLLEARNLQRHFLQTIANVPNFGVSTFEVDEVTFNTSMSAKLDSATVQVCSLYVAFDTNKKQREFLNLFDWTHVQSKPRARAVIPFDAVVGARLEPGAVRLSLVNPLGFSLQVSMVSTQAEEICELVNAVVSHVESRPHPEEEHDDAYSSSDRSTSNREFSPPNMAPKHSPKQKRLSSYRHSENWRSRTLASALQSAQQTLITCQGNIADTILLEHTPTANPSRRKLESKHWETGVLELSSIKGCLSTIRDKVHQGEFFHDFSQRSIEMVDSLSTSIDQLVKCVVSSAALDPLPAGLQAIADATFHFLSLCADFFDEMDAIYSNEDMRAKSKRLTTMKALLDSCVALKVAMQCNFCEGITATALAACCNDMQVAIDSIADLSAQAERSPCALKSGLRSSISSLRLFSYLSAENNEVFVEIIIDTLEHIRSTANTLVGAAVARDPSGSSEAHSNRAAAARFAWGCLDHSMKLFAGLLKLVEPSIHDDALFVPLIRMTYEAVGAAKVIFSSEESNVRKRYRAFDNVVSVAEGLQRTCALLSESLAEKSANIIAKVRDSKLDLASRELPSCVFQLLPLVAEALGCLRNAAASPEVLLKQDLKVLVTTAIVFRSTLLRCSLDPGFVKVRDNHKVFLRQIQEQLDVLLRGLSKSFFTAILDLGSLQLDFATCLKGFAAVLTESTRHMRLLCESLEQEIDKLGIFGESVLSIKKLLLRFKEEFTNDFQKAHIEASRGDAERCTLHRKSTRKLQLMRTTSSLFSRVHPLYEIETTSITGEVSPSELLNETIFLEHVENLMLTGEAKQTGTNNFKDALDVYVTTFPYWTGAETFLAQIIPVLVNPDSIANIDIDSRVVSALCRMLRLHPRLVEDPSCRIMLNRAIAFLSNTSPPFTDGRRAIEDAIALSLEMIARFDRIVKEKSNPTVLPSETAKIDLMTVDLQTLAEQITVVEQQFFQAVSVGDILQSNYNRTTNSLTLWIEHTNALGSWFASRILQLEKPKQRAKLIHRIFQLTDILRSMRNYSVVVTIFATLSGHAISGLQKTWNSSKDLKSKLQELDQSIQPMRNFARYREELQSLDVPCIPFMAVLTRDLAIVEEVMSSSILEASGSSSRSGSVSSSSRKSAASSGSALPSSPLFANMKNMTTISNIISSQFTKFRRVEYLFSTDPKFFPELFNPELYEVFDSDDMITISNSLEPAKRASAGSNARSSASRNRVVVVRRSFDSSREECEQNS